MINTLPQGRRKLQDRNVVPGKENSPLRGPRMRNGPAAYLLPVAPGARAGDSEFVCPEPQRGLLLGICFGLWREPFKSQGIRPHAGDGVLKAYLEAWE